MRCVNMAETKVTSTAPTQKTVLTQTTWENLSEPGAYVELGTGDLYRVQMPAKPRVELQEAVDPKRR